MKNLIGYFLRTLLLSSLFFLSFISFSHAASGVNSTGNLTYTIDEQNNKAFQLDVLIKNSGALPSVVNYYTIYLPFKSPVISSVRVNGRNFTYTKHSKNDGVEIIVDLESVVIPSKKSMNIQFKGTLNFDLAANWSYFKIPSQISGLTISNLVVQYPISKSAPTWFSDMQANYETSSNSRTITLKHPKASQFSAVLGDQLSYEFRINKTYINYDKDAKVFDLLLPKYSDKQLFILTNISPKPAFVKDDSDGNIILGFNVEGLEQEVVNISGNIQFSSQNKEEYNNILDDPIGYWNMTNEKEIARVRTYIALHKGSLLPLVLNQYVKERLDMKELNKNSLENILRGGATIATARPTQSIPEDYSDLLIALLRYYSIPSRMVVGYIPASSIYSQEGFFHTWVEYKDEANGAWNVLDPALSDFLKLNVETTDTRDHLALITRSANSITPKLPYFAKDELAIAPTVNSQSYIFDVTSHNNTIKNNGNGVIKVTTSGLSSLLLPGEEVNIVSESDSAYAKDPIGNIKEVKLSTTTTNETNKVNIFVESLIFFLFVSLLLFIHFVYDRIKKLWRLTDRS